MVLARGMVTLFTYKHHPIMHRNCATWTFYKYIYNYKLLDMLTLFSWSPFQDWHSSAHYGCCRPSIHTYIWTKIDYYKLFINVYWNILFSLWNQCFPQAFKFSHNHGANLTAIKFPAVLHGLYCASYCAYMDGTFLKFTPLAEIL